ncbi:hypothetical protein SAMN04487897_101881 [Paenibacillus sp. yr247]|uniref:hypothetical protein n=1 Tax=Paenibacillus sp. yr247 TaxID=1761880 RepID=UPI0008918981|nr:hypothetical protein [Paenibacillus sp. yr247]SDN04107.1 hypothetical protein SAMN04487897_101881 [Paenibacillus sp. yr247]
MMSSILIESEYEASAWIAQLCVALAIPVSCYDDRGWNRYPYHHLIAPPFLITGLSQKCAINQMLGRNTCKIR